jgi:hypothetical protein
MVPDAPPQPPQKVIPTVALQASGHNEVSSQSKPVEIKLSSVSYGTNCAKYVKGNAIDTSAFHSVQTQCEGKTDCVYRIYNINFGDGTEPIPGCRKSFVVNYECLSSSGVVLTKTSEAHGANGRSVALSCNDDTGMTQSVTTQRAPMNLPLRAQNVEAENKLKAEIEVAIEKLGSFEKQVDLVAKLDQSIVQNNNEGHEEGLIKDLSEKFREVEGKMGHLVSDQYVRKGSEIGVKQQPEVEVDYRVNEIAPSVASSNQEQQQETQPQQQPQQHQQQELQTNAPPSLAILNEGNTVHHDPFQPTPAVVTPHTKHSRRSHHRKSKKVQPITPQ